MKSETLTIRPVAHIESDLPTKFGLPRQSGLVPQLQAKIILEPPYGEPAAFKGMEGFSHLWLLWGFSRVENYSWSATVKPPRLGGNTKMGVFATRSPFRPNGLGLSSVKLERIAREESGTVLYVSGADLMSGTPIYDIKPYLPYADSHPEAKGGFAEAFVDYGLQLRDPEGLLESMIPEDKREALRGLLRQDPRPSYINDPRRRYGFNYLDMDVRFTVDGDTLTVVEIVKLQP